MEKYARIENKPSTLKEIERQTKRFLPYWGERGLSSITKNEVQEMHNRIGREHGKYEANRALAYIRAIYDKMIDWVLLEKRTLKSRKKRNRQGENVA
jgi:hypothetical protein